MTAVYKGSDDTTSPALLRTYNSTHATAPSSDITIWEAGRATCATYPAFKSIQIGQSIFLDEGSGRYSPVAQVLEEALVHEWPGREVGLLVSIGSGKAPETEYKKETSSMIAASPLGKFIEAKEKHMAKVLDCEEIHKELLDGLHRTGVKPENYVRLNVESGITDFGMNEWSRIADISTRTRAYLGRPDIQVINQSAAAKLAEIARISSGRNTVSLVVFIPFGEMWRGGLFFGAFHRLILSTESCQTCPLELLIFVMSSTMMKSESTLNNSTGSLPELGFNTTISLISFSIFILIFNFVFICFR